MKKIKRLLSISLVIIFIATGSFSASASEYGSYFESMLQFVQSMYYKDITDEEALKAALEGLIGGLDKYSAYYDFEEMEVFKNNLNGNYVGIGAVLEESGSYIKIIKIYEGSPAEMAGLLEGDLIISVDGVSVLDKDVESVAASIRGEAGTLVKLVVKRGELTKEFTIVRAMVNIRTVQYRLEGNIAYIHIDTFGEGTSKEFNEAIEQVNKNGIRKIILDLRGNPGGYVDEAVAVARKLVPEGVITTLDYKSEEFHDRVYYSYGGHPDYIVAVLVDENTASASEIVAGALEDSGNGFLIGQNTYGKGVFQSTFTILTPEAYKKYGDLYGAQYVSEIQWLSYHGVLLSPEDILGYAMITTGHYLTPNGREIDGVGLKPLITVPNPTNPNGIDLSKVSLLSNLDPIGVSNYGAEVYNAESVLKALGYLETVPDKQFDSATTDAVKKFQSDNGLPVTGTIDLRTRDSLNNAFLEFRNENERQYAKAVQMLNLFRD